MWKSFLRVYTVTNSTVGSVCEKEQKVANRFENSIMAILNIFVLLLSLVCVSCQQDKACIDVQQKLQGLSEAVQTMCGSSTPSPTAATPPSVVQPCDCGSAVNWTSVTMTSIVSSNLRNTGTLTYDIPSVIPSSAKEVLLLASVGVGYSGPEGRSHYIKIYTEQGTHQYEKYIFIFSYGQGAWNTNSDNLWFPLTTERKVYVKLTYAHSGNLNLYIHAIGYR